MKVGDKVTLIYDPRPLGQVQYGRGVITKITPTGLLRIKGKTGNIDRDELFYPLGNLTGNIKAGYAKGWNTLWFNEYEDNDDDDHDHD